jgi:signal transduction histidine kinase
MFTRLSVTRAAIDAGVAFVYLVVGITLEGAGSPSEVGIVILLAVGLGLRRFSPLIALGICWGAALLQMYFAQIGPIWPDVAILAVMYTTAAYGDRTTRWIGFGSIFVGAILGGIYLEWGTGTPTIGVSVTVRSIADAARTLVNIGFDFVLMLGLLGAPWAAGTIVRTRIAARDSRLAQQAVQTEMQAVEQDVIVEQERNRIARDMHDVVAHSLAVVIAQADGARYAQAKDPSAVDGALTAISTTAREALADVRLLLGQLRHPQTEGPQPALSDLTRLLEQLSASGLKTAFETKGTPLVLGTGQQLAVYRIVQEALTNVLRHGDISQQALVRFEWTPDNLEVTITSAIVASPATAELRLGHGLAGMKERAALVGGRLSATSDDKHFVVTATIPSTLGVRA